MRTQAFERSSEWWNSLQKQPAQLPENADVCKSVLLDESGNTISTQTEWNSRRRAIRQNWLNYLGEIKHPTDPPQWKVLESDTRDGVLRELVEYESEPGLPVEGYLLRPIAISENAIKRKLPAVAVFHSTVDHTIRQPAGLDGPADKWIGLRLAQAGYVVFCPRCYLWQYGEPKNLLKAVNWLYRRHLMVRGMAKMLFDAMRAVDLLESLAEVHPQRIGSVGHSLGAKEVLYLAAFDERVKATVSSEGGIGIGYSNWNAPWYLDSAIDNQKMQLNHADLLALVAPRAFLLVGGDSADGDISWPYIQANLPLWKLAGQPQALGNWNHKQGHAFPSEAMAHTIDWFDRYLKG